MKIKVEFDLNDSQIESVKDMAKYEPGWSHCDLIIRFDGQDKRFGINNMKPTTHIQRGKPSRIIHKIAEGLMENTHMDYLQSLVAAITIYLDRVDETAHQEEQ